MEPGLRSPFCQMGNNGRVPGFLRGGTEGRDGRPAGGTPQQEAVAALHAPGMGSGRACRSGSLCPRRPAGPWPRLLGRNDSVSRQRHVHEDLTEESGCLESPAAMAPTATAPTATALRPRDTLPASARETEDGEPCSPSQEWEGADALSLRLLCAHLSVSDEGSQPPARDL